jgi:methylated-DNA-[protein]-cysteine S-methyltransferase
LKLCARRIRKTSDGMEAHNPEAYTERYVSPLGELYLSSDGSALTGLWFEGQKYCRKAAPIQEAALLPVFQETENWLDLYFSGKVPDFTPPLRFRSTLFREEVWRILMTIPYGETMTYGEIADRIAREKKLIRVSARAVGNACGHNPISIIIPCHRVIGKDGSLTGYAGGLSVKEKLLSLEKSFSGNSGAVN